jgi:hypothetical protein
VLSGLVCGHQVEEPGGSLDLWVLGLGRGHREEEGCEPVLAQPPCFTG